MNSDNIPAYKFFETTDADKNSLSEAPLYYSLSDKQINAIISAAINFKKEQKKLLPPA